jgi:putative transposase
MGRPLRAAEGGFVYHCLNRANARLAIFTKDGDFEAFERVVAEAIARHDMQLLAYCIMRNHFHLVLWPKADGDLSRFMRWLTLTHTQRWHAHRHSAGSGHLYQGRYKPFPVQSDEHLYTVCRYVERNALRAGLVERAEQWRWGSLWWTGQKSAGTGSPRAGAVPLCSWPIARPRNWVERVNTPLTRAEEQAVLRCIQRSRPYGEPEWQMATVSRLGLESAFRPRGRPRKEPVPAADQNGS